MGDGGGEGRVAVALALALAPEVEVEALRLGLFDAAPRLGADREEGQARGKGERLLASHDHDVDPPGLGLEPHRPRPRDGVHDEQGPRAIADDAGQSFDVVAGAGGRLRELDGHRAQGGITVEGRGNGFRGHRLPPGCLQGLDQDPVCLADLDEALPEVSGHEREHALARSHGVDDRSFHSPRAGAGQDEHVARRLQEFLEPGAALLEEGTKFLAAMMRNGARERLQDARVERRRARREQPFLLQHGSDPSIARVHRFCGKACGNCGRLASKSFISDYLKRSALCDSSMTRARDLRDGRTLLPKISRAYRWAPRRGIIEVFRGVSPITNPTPGRTYGCTGGRRCVEK